MLRPAGIDPRLIREAPSALASDTAMYAATLQGVQQASGIRATRWASTKEIQGVLHGRGEKDSAHAVLLMLPQLLDEGVLEQQARADGLYWRRRL